MRLSSNVFVVAVALAATSAAHASGPSAPSPTAKPAAPRGPTSWFRRAPSQPAASAPPVVGPHATVPFALPKTILVRPSHGSPTQASARAPVPEAHAPRALVPNGKGGTTALEPDLPGSSGFHGTAYHAAEVPKLLKHGLPARGNNWNLHLHSEGATDTAFRGTTHDASMAAEWADEGRVVFDIRGVPGWNVNAALDGRVQRGARFGGNLMSGENEVAIPAAVSPDRIARWGVVVRSASGRLFVKEWHENPNFTKD